MKGSVAHSLQLTEQRFKHAARVTTVRTFSALPVAFEFLRRSGAKMPAMAPSRIYASAAMPFPRLIFTQRDRVGCCRVRRSSCPGIKANRHGMGRNLKIKIKWYSTTASVPAIEPECAKENSRIGLTAWPLCGFMDSESCTRFKVNIEHGKAPTHWQWPINGMARRQSGRVPTTRLDCS